MPVSSSILGKTLAGTEKGFYCRFIQADVYGHALMNPALKAYAPLKAAKVRLSG